eukprot:Clim_evm27s211 gene=Clim_evmTU27s211
MSSSGQDAPRKRPSVTALQGGGDSKSPPAGPSEPRNRTSPALTNKLKRIGGGPSPDLPPEQLLRDTSFDLSSPTATTVEGEHFEQMPDTQQAQYLIKMAQRKVVSLTQQYPQLRILEQSSHLKMISTILREKTCGRATFVFYADRLFRLLVEEGLNHMPTKETTVITPTGEEYKGMSFAGKICGVSIMRAGEAMERALRDCCRTVRIGKILVQKDYDTGERHVYYAKLPQDVDERHCLLMDPVLSTGGTLYKAVQVLKDSGVAEERITILTLIAAVQGVDRLLQEYPTLTIVAAEVDDDLDDQGLALPGIGDFGDRYFGTLDDDEIFDEDNLIEE